MRCPFCGAADTKVIDSRLAAEGDQVRRRRSCVVCEERFTTYEKVELSLPRIVKTDGSRVYLAEDQVKRAQRDFNAKYNATQWVRQAPPTLE